MTNVQYLNTVRDLFPGLPFENPVLPNENVVGGFSGTATGQTATSVFVEAYEQAASRIAEAARAQFSTVEPCQPTNMAEELTCARGFIARFGKKAYRRPLGQDEGDRLLAFFQERRADDNFPSALTAVIEVMLQSPPFLFRLEGANATPGGDATPLTSFELASRLSYLLSGSMPDGPLMDAADRDQLTTPEAIEAHARRLLEQPRARAAVSRFNYEWLKLGRMEDLQKDAAGFPDFSPSVARSLRDSTIKFVERAFWSDHALETLLTDSHGYVNDEIARYFGVSPPGSSELQLVELDPTQRAGVLTQPGLLAALSGPVQNSPVQRGVLVLDSLLCNRPPPPPAGVNTMEPPVDPSLPMTTRQRFVSQHEQGPCASCHLVIDGIGFAFENFDATGAWRTDEAGQSIDASARLVGSDVDGDVEGAVALVQRLAQSLRVAECVTYHWMRYALGLDDTQINLAAARPVAAQFVAGAGPMSELLVNIARSEAFRSVKVSP